MSYQRTKTDKALAILLRVIPLIIIILLGMYFFTDIFSSDDKDPNEEQTNQPQNEQADQAENNAVRNNENEEVNNNEEPVSDNETTNVNDPVEEDPVSLEELSDLLVQALAERDLATIAQYVDPEQGLLFSPYVYVHEDAIVFEKEAVGTLLASEDVFNWGDYDGKGTPIELTPAAYFEEFMDMTPYVDKDEVLIDNLQDRGNTLNNVGDVFPDARIVEYYNEGSEEYAGIDWASLILVYQEDASGQLTLMALIRDHWTI